MRSLALTIAYDGTEFVGWQVQPNGPSVQAAVEQALAKVLGHSVTVRSAGRTDSGVHALGQVASFTTGSTIPREGLRKALQALLPDAIVVHEVRETVSEFHATYDAIRKRYRYLIHNAPIRSPFLGRYVWEFRHRLDLEAMRQAAVELIGTHDFRCFESQFPNRATSVRTIEAVELGRTTRWNAWMQPGLMASQPEPHAIDDETDGEILWMEITADGFLYNMVRAIMGTLRHVGTGRWDASTVRDIIRNQDRSQAGETAPPQGLYMVQVDYPAEKFLSAND